MLTFCEIVLITGARVLPIDWAPSRGELWNPTFRAIDTRRYHMGKFVAL